MPLVSCLYKHVDELPGKHSETSISFDRGIPIIPFLKRNKCIRSTIVDNTKITNKKLIKYIIQFIRKFFEFFGSNFVHLGYHFKKVDQKLQNEDLSTNTVFLKFYQDFALHFVTEIK